MYFVIMYKSFSLQIFFFFLPMRHFESLSQLADRGSHPLFIENPKRTFKVQVDSLIFLNSFDEE